LNSIFDLFSNWRGDTLQMSRRQSAAQTFRVLDSRGLAKATPQVHRDNFNRIARLSDSGPRNNLTQPRYRFLESFHSKIDKLAPIPSAIVRVNLASIHDAGRRTIACTMVFAFGCASGQDVVGLRLFFLQNVLIDQEDRGPCWYPQFSMRKSLPKYSSLRSGP